MRGISTVGTALAVLLCSWPAAAQFNNGAIIVTVPQTESSATKPAQPPKSTPQKRRRTTPKPRAQRPKTRKPRRTAVRSRGTDTRATPGSKVKIVVLVNDDPITQYEVEQRASLLASGSKIGQRASSIFKNLVKRKSTNDRLRAILKQTVEANRGKSRQQILAIFERRKKAYARQLQRQAVTQARRAFLPGLRRRATEELIDERLKLQAAKQAKVLATKAEVDQVMRGIAKRNKLSYEAFKAQLKRSGTDIYTMRQRVRASMSWSRLVGAKFGRLVDVNQKAIDESVSSSGSDADKVSLHLHRLTLGLPDKLSQQAIAQRMVEAEGMRRRFSGCESTSSLTKGGHGVLFRDLGYRIATSVPEPTRSVLLNAKVGEMAPPATTKNGVTLYAVCGRRSGSSSLAARARAADRLRQKGTEVYSRKYLADLRREAHVEYR